MDKKIEMNPNLLVRVPLGWLKRMDMAAKCNPLEQAQDKDFSYKQTFERRALGQYCGLPY